ncbi:MAG: GNAT family N-acetyltransferase [Rhizobiaceae bacterium]|nr:GNAT family N-acetyltransferase [Rhizobiaceae bacterium]PCI02741.1 MAG: hypothetical protein COB78_12180 [Hyphomicrobiales bacterium]
MNKFQLIEPDGKIYAELSDRFEEYNSAHSTWNWQSYCLVHQVDGHIVAGGRGIINMGALEVRGLWVNDDLRGSGIGTHLLVAIEDEARNRGATRAMLYTFSWQAQKFYERAGYSEFSRFNYPDGFQRIDLQKDL